jgi:hypothetical protein
MPEVQEEEKLSARLDAAIKAAIQFLNVFEVGSVFSYQDRNVDRYLSAMEDCVQPFEFLGGSILDMVTGKDELLDMELTAELRQVLVQAARLVPILERWSAADSQAIYAMIQREGEVSGEEDEAARPLFRRKDDVRGELLTFLILTYNLSRRAR